MNIVRNIGIMLGLAVLSFIIGFFVLGKILPSNQTPPKSDTQVAMNNVASQPVKNALADNGVAVETPLTPKSPVVRQPASTPVDPKANRSGVLDRGPVLDAADEVKTGVVATDTQKPRKLELETGRAATVAPQGAEQAGVIEQRPARKRHRKLRPSPPVQEVAAADASATDETGDSKPDSMPDTTGSDVTPPKKSSLYRVHLGSYHTKEAASKQMELAKDKGFDTQVLPVTRHGKTMYRVQLGAFKDKDRADGEKQRLHEAGLDAKVADPD